jgi:hypothetical protein
MMKSSCYRAGPNKEVDECECGQHDGLTTPLPAPTGTVGIKTMQAQFSVLVYPAIRMECNRQRLNAG